MYTKVCGPGNCQLQLWPLWIWETRRLSFAKLFLFVWVARRPIPRILESSLLFSLIIGSSMQNPSFINTTEHFIWYTHGCAFIYQLFTRASGYEMINSQRGALLRVGCKQFPLFKKLLAAIICGFQTEDTRMLTGQNKPYRPQCRSQYKPWWYF